MISTEFDPDPGYEEFTTLDTSEDECAGNKPVLLENIKRQ